MSDESFNKLMKEFERDDKWILPLLFIIGVIVYIFFILVITGNLHYVSELFGG
jgi:hypothetical protein